MAKIIAKREEFIKARIRNGLSGDDLGMAANVGRGAISNIERGKNGISPSTAKKLADALGVEFDAIFEIEISELNNG